jgi:chromosome segregation ATPase
MSDDTQEDQLAEGAPGAAKAQVEALREVLARAKREREERDRRQVELFERLEAKVAGEQQTREEIARERAEAESRIVHLEHTLAQAVRRLALIDEKLAAAAAQIKTPDDGNGAAATVEASGPQA